MLHSSVSAFFRTGWLGYHNIACADEPAASGSRGHLSCASCGVHDRTPQPGVWLRYLLIGIPGSLLFTFETLKKHRALEPVITALFGAEASGVAESLKAAGSMINFFVAFSLVPFAIRNPVIAIRHWRDWR